MPDTAIPTPSERAAATRELEQSRDELLQTCAALTPSDWTRTDGAGRWTVAGIVEHLGIVERRVHTAIEAMLAAPAEPDWAEGTAGQDDRIPAAATVTTPIVAPEVLHPHSGQPSEQLLAEFKAARAANLELSQRPGLPLKEHTRVHPVLGRLHGLQWLRITAYHTRRHRAQIERCLRQAV